MWHQTLDPIKCLVLSNLPYGWEVWIRHRCRRQLPASPARHMWQKWESKMTKSMSPAGPVAVRRRSAQQQSMGTGQTGGLVHFKALSQLLNRELKSGHGKKAGLAEEKLQGHTESQLLTMWRGCANIRQAKLKCKNSKTERLILGKCVWRPRRRKGRAASAMCSTDRGESPSPKALAMCTEWGKAETCTGLFSHILTLGKQSASRKKSPI